MVRKRPQLRRYLKMRRIRRPKDKEKLFESLTKGEKEYNFEFFKDIFMLALAVGYKKQRKVPLNKKEWLFIPMSILCDKPVLSKVSGSLNGVSLYQ